MIFLSTASEVKLLKDGRGVHVLEAQLQAEKQKNKELHKELRQAEIAQTR